MLNLKRPTEGGDLAYPQELEEWLAATLAMIAGYLDAYGMITYHTYLSFMSGNTTRSGYEIGRGNFGPAVDTILAIVFFVSGSFAGSMLAHLSVPRSRRLVFGAMAASLALIIGCTLLGLFSNWVGVALISFVMGAMNTALAHGGARSRIGAPPVNLTFVTGTLSRIGVQLALAVRRAPITDSLGPWDTHSRRALLMAGIWAGFLGGALLSGAATSRFGVSALFFPMLILSALAAFDRSWSAEARPDEFSTIYQRSDP